MPAIDPRNIEVVEPHVAMILRVQSARQSIQQALEAHGLGRRLVESGVRSQHPDWDDHAVRVEVLRRMHGDAIATVADGRHGA